MLPSENLIFPFVMEHAHSDGSKHRLRQVDDPTEHDQEREWGHAQIFKCTTCDETVAVIPKDSQR